MTNRLAHSSSPYLLQHANNPVDWWPWCDEAFDEARRRNVPVFLSIGYSTCYWCHVMERESFENPAIAQQLRESFVAIKLDREERPDIDEMYMAATIAMTGSGGWPMSVFLEPQTRKPFYCGTYFPSDDHPRYGRPTFPQVLSALSNAWKTQRDGVIQQADEVASDVAKHLESTPPQNTINREQVADALSELLRRFDRQRGGFGAAPKFPQPVYLDFLLDVRAAAADDATSTAIDAALQGTLDAMVIGGIYDQLRGGFHRYSVDASWTVPHFEKMLYDNAMLASVYARAAGMYNYERYTRTALQTYDYILAEMTDAATGLFFSAQDAAVDHREGVNYLWSAADVIQLTKTNKLSLEDAHLAISLFKLEHNANFVDPHHPPVAGEPSLHVLRLHNLPEVLAAEASMTPAAFYGRFDHIREVMLQSRSARKQPMLDDKIVTSWNGLMITALADGYIHLPDSIPNRDRLLNAAERAARSAEHLLILPDAEHTITLLRTRRGENAGPAATLEDYAALAMGFINVHRATSRRDSGNDGYYITLAQRIVEAAYSRFTVGTRLVDSSATDLFVRPSLTHDGAVPCGNSLMLHALLGLYECTAQQKWLSRSMELLASISGAIHASPLSTVNSTRALFKALMISDEAAETLSRAAPLTSPAEYSSDSQSIDAVEIFSEVERISLSAAQPAAVVTLLLKIAPGWHVNSAHSQDAPLRVHSVGGAGIDVYCDYPAPSLYAAPGQQPIEVYEGSTELRIVVERQETATPRNRPLLAVTFQACNDTACQQPRTVELDIAIDIT